MSEINGAEPWNVARLPLAPARRALGTSPADNRRDDNPQSVSVGPISEEPGATAPHSTDELANSSHLRIVLAYFVIAFVAQLLLLVPQVARFRIELRMMPFATSLLLAAYLPKARAVGHRMHPALPFAVIIICIISLGMVNQLTDNLIAGAAQICLTAAILSPLLWIGRLQIGFRGFATIVLCLWAFNAISAGVGVLQVLFPGHLQPITSSVVQDIEESGATFNIELADGTQTTRPYGLTDQPGGAATAGLTTFVFGLGLLVSTKNPVLRALFLAGMGLGLFIMYLSQVRASIVMCGIATIAFVGIMAVRGEFARLTGALLALTVVVAVSTAAAFLIGGNETRSRLFTLVDDDARTVYQQNRGRFLDYTFDYALPTYPVGAGLGRYGMMARYFNPNPRNEPLWAEIQWTAWAYDGGWLMVVAYPTALIVGVWLTFNIGRKAIYGPVGLWAAILTSYNISVIAVLFSYSFFLSQSGLEFWLLNAAIFSAAQVYLRSLKPEVPQGFEVIPAPWRPSLPAANTSSSASAPAPRRPPLQQRRLPTVLPVFDAPDQPAGRT